MKVIFSHPTGNANARAAVEGFLEADMLYEFYTSIAAFKGNFYDRLGSLGPLSEIRRRQFNQSLQPLTKTSPWREAGRVIASKLGLSALIQHETGPFCIDEIYKNMDKRVASRLKRASANGAAGVYAYEDGAAASFTQARHLGLKCLYDLPIGYWRSAQQLLEKEKDRWPDWFSTLSGFNDSETKLARKDEELRLADRIFVASTFTAQTLKSFPEVHAPVDVIPYGFPPVVKNRHYPSLSNRPLKLLFVGGLSQRKGIADLFAAVEKFKNHITLTIVGRKGSNDCLALDENLSKHNWIQSLPHNSILELMREQDVLIFPSLFEGFGLVITEAMSQGTPVITTDRTAGPDVIEDGKNGWLIEAGSPDAIQKALEEIIQHPESVERRGRAAMETARKRSWRTYGQELAIAVNKTLQ